MINFENYINLPFIWGGLIAIAVMVYVILDGFDLGIGIIFPFVSDKKDRDMLIGTIAPFWDGNETWLVLSGGGLLAAFPKAYGIFMPALYIPIIIMLMGLILRGASFEFRFKAKNYVQSLVWDMVFHFGSLVAAFMQGIIIGAVIQGIKVSNMKYAGTPLDWATGFNMLTGIAVVFGYSMLGSTWLMMHCKEKVLFNWAKKVAIYTSFFVGLSMLMVSIAMPISNQHVRDLWFSLPEFLFLLPIPFIAFISFIVLWISLYKADKFIPFFCTVIIFVLSFSGICITMYPWLVPYSVNLHDAAATGTSQSILLIGAIIMLPVILSYTGYCYYLMWNKDDRKKAS
ncbi:cytochrome d ubiquinol oxidase subunit II [Anaplasmataceae bacterium AB001_6]|nr:cytochrome d ubiquinol oxidase subunit II [Anaplasmataceae bacterium AB001_6]